MSLYALENLDDALDATRALLWPIDRSRWLRLAPVALLVGGSGAGLNLGGGGGGGADAPVSPPGPGEAPTGGPADQSLPAVGTDALLAVGALVAVVLAVVLALLLLGAIMEFVLVESLRRESVALRRYWSERWRQGLRLFGFRVGLGLLVLGGLAALAAVVVLPFLGVGTGLGSVPDALGVLGLVVVVPALVLVGLVVALVDGFTTAFVVPVMVLENEGVLAGWRRFWPTLVASPWQYLAYAVLAFVLSLVGGVVVAVATVLGVVVLAVPFGLLVAVGVGLTAVVAPVGIALIVVAALSFGLGLLAVVALARVPVVTYLRYYALLVLGDVEPDLDLIPERRGAIRADGTGEGAAGAGDDGR